MLLFFWYYRVQYRLCLTLVTPWTVACQALLSMGFPRQDCWSGLPFLLPRDLPDPGIKSTFPVSLALQVDSLSIEPSRKHQGGIFPHKNSISCFKKRKEDLLLSSNKALWTSTANKKPLQLWTQSSLINLLKTTLLNFLFIVVWWLSHVWFFAIPWDAACQASLSFTVSWSMLKFMSTESVTPLAKVSFCVSGLACDSPGQVFKLQFPCYSQINSACW